MRAPKRGRRPVAVVVVLGLVSCVESGSPAADAGQPPTVSASAGTAVPPDDADTDTQSPPSTDTDGATVDDSGTTGSSTDDGNGDGASTGLEEPEPDDDMIAAILATTPDQHPMEARFTKIPGSEIDVLVQCDEFPEFGQDIACYKSHNAFVDWTGGAWNWVDWEFTQPAGGGHCDYGGNEVYLAELSITPRGTVRLGWSRPIDPQPLSPQTCGAPVAGPVASHTYGSPMFIESTGEYFHATTGGWPACGGDCDPEDKAPGQGLWVHDKKAWRKISDAAVGYPRGCYHRNADKVYIAKGGSEVRYVVDVADDYAVSDGVASGGWLNTSPTFDSAMDQIRDVCYGYTGALGIRGFHYDPATGERTQVFQSETIDMLLPSLSVEHSTGNLVAVGTDGFVMHFDTTTGDELEISAPDGIPFAGTTAENIYGKFDMIEKIPCVGIGMSDPRDGVFLMTLPASVCTMDPAQ